ncbi:MAG: acetyl-CoA carboxylase biotin carboxylase subunit [Paludibacteraceae bacterium]|jgi:acetyl-CoA carboxylase biotin carboxylase subunit|nr:acetyl-CoA carboxylase biotin carboxylase subunit [Paludibacteraceae bacterium]
MIKKILIANRGEIAVRVMRSCKEMNIATVAVYSEADRTSRHVLYADEAICIGPAPSKDSYLVIDNLIAAAKQTGADAIHPGYGFLSESSDFARRCAKEGIIWIGPSPEAMEMMGDKITARKTMIEAGVPVVPGVQHDLSLEEAKKVIKEIGYPVIVKASAGGGGKGMRVIRKDEEIEEAYNTAKSEALSSFANGTLYIEKYIENPHHIEFQILGDNFGNVIHLCERECSVQRRHQKIVEESPSPMMTADLRKDMGEKAIMAAKAVNYSGAGTIEFLVDDNKNYYFLEMNTRLQVEHPITEEVLRIDLVKEQINVANNLPLRLHQEDIVQRGHAIECRICAEDTENNFMPSPGIIQQLTEPLGIGTRVDNYVYEGYEIPVFYDPMIGKLIVWATTRAYAIKRMRRVLFEYKITGIKTNINYLRRIMDASDFLRGKYDTGFIEKNSEFLLDEHYEGSQDETEDIAIIAAYMDYILNLEENATKTTDNRVISKWREFGKRNAMLRI